MLSDQLLRHADRTSRTQPTPRLDATERYIRTPPIEGGNANSAYVAGHCAHLIVKGSHNKLVVDNADAIDTDGSGNQVVYHTGAPQISVGGTGNVVRKG